MKGPYIAYLYLFSFAWYRYLSSFLYFCFL